MSAEAAGDQVRLSEHHRRPVRLSGVGGAGYNEMTDVVAGTAIQAQLIGEVAIAVPAPPHQSPAQLPPAPAQFVNRATELALLDGLVARARQEARPAVVVLTGMGGVGKTALANRWAHAHRDEFVGGQLHVVLSNYRHRGGVAVGDVLGAFLRALGVHEHYIPAALAERAAMFRTRTSATPVLVLADDADQAAQIRPLLPGCATSMVLVTSRLRLSGLVTDGAGVIELRPLDSAAGSALVASMLPAEQSGTQPQALRELVALCAGLPIALRVAAARLTLRRRWSVTTLVRYLADDQSRLRRLSVGGERVTNVFDLAYAELPGPAQALYRRLGLHPGGEFGLPVVAYLAEVPLDRADESLEALREANLLEEVGDDRYRLHDLVRLHARALAEQDGELTVAENVLRRMVAWYLLGAAAADRAVLGANRWRLTDHDVLHWRPEFHPASAMDWFETERSNLVEAVRCAALRQWDDLVWQFCEALWPFYYGRKHYADWIETHRLGVRAAVSVGNQVAETRMHNQLARAHVELGEFRLAGQELDAAWQAAVGSADARAKAVVIESYGVLHRQQGDFAAAAARFGESRALNERIGDRRGIALQSYHLGDALLRDGRPGEALAALSAALDLLGPLDDQLTEAKVRIVLGVVYWALGRVDEAALVLTHAVRATRERRLPIKEAQALEALIDVVPRDRDSALFDTSTSRLLSLYEQAGSPRAELVLAWIERGHRTAEQG